VIAAVALRLAAMAVPSAGGWLLQVSALCWASAFASYLWRFTPWMIRPRPDRPPAPPTRS
jgi:uncharacterized protein involved in response to NO